ncbi:hypothetical protein KIH27_04535 [Mycobacterium sp. M1]|uniref:Uncharacterized protein n=1 Tax=Mycolicibacter acidiphilus TaxID=2835306 RepID=A0ABS5RGZ4_9MYCO|nr:DUF6636 domain-containing protein [Mycolicibacter acidiphilus]MBS9532853.1 hypothetical protein [Mycolicibacter acidiphilus]
MVALGLVGPGLAGPAHADPDPTWFRSPTGNIVCDIRPGDDVPYLRCDVKDPTFTPPPAPPIHTRFCGQGPWGRSLQMSRDEPAHFQCISDTVFKDGLPVLAYGTETTRYGFRCASATDGITCTDQGTGRGFRLARDSYAIF